jgi:hypothetical protein
LEGEAMTTYAIMQARIADEFINESITTAHIKNAIQSAISAYENTPLYFNQKISSFNTVNSQEYYSEIDYADIPNIVYFRAVNVDVNGSDKAIQPVDFNLIDKVQTGSDFGVPNWYSYFAQKIRLYPIPNAVYSIRISYIAKFAALVADSDSNAWMIDGEELIRQAAKRRLALDILHANDMAARCKVLEDEAMDGLLEETRQRTQNQFLRIPAMLGNNRFNINMG